jgi:hypothetical protein
MLALPYRGIYLIKVPQIQKMCAAACNFIGYKTKDILWRAVDYLKLLCYSVKKRRWDEDV